MSYEVDKEDLKGAEQLEDGERIEVEGYELKFELSLVNEMSLNECHVRVFLERNDEELSDVADHYTVERYDVDQVTERLHDMSAKEVMVWLMNLAEEAFNG